MTVAALFDAARTLKRETVGLGLTQAEVDALNAIIEPWGQKLVNPTALSDGEPFYAAVRAAFGPLSQPQVDGFQTLLQAFAVARWPISWAAYGLATAFHETAAKMQPVREAFWLGEEWRREHLRYYPWYGRGYVQLTWEENYEKADEELGLDGALLKDPDEALNPGIAAEIMVKGMEQGWFCTKKLPDYLPLSGKAGFDAYVQARRIINGTDRAEKIAREAQSFEHALELGGWQ